MRGWLLASVDGNKEGIIPASYVRVVIGLEESNIPPEIVVNQI
jgi:hypothetical protein